MIMEEGVCSYLYVERLGTRMSPIFSLVSRADRDGLVEYYDARRGRIKNPKHSTKEFCLEDISFIHRRVADDV